MAIKIFISYRRDDSAPYAGRLYDRLKGEFGAENLFMDIDSIAIGQDFVKILNERLESSNALISIIGRQWLTSVDRSGNRRLDNPEDFVRSEISSAIKRQIPIIPILVGGADMPGSHDVPDDLEALVRYQALEISDTRFHQDVDLLIDTLKIKLPHIQVQTPIQTEQEEIDKDNLAQVTPPRKIPEFKLRHLLQTDSQKAAGVLCVAFNPDGGSFVSADTDGRIIVWDANTGEETMRWHEHHAPVYVVQYSHDGRIMASAGMDEKIICWDTATGIVRKILDGPNKTILSLAFSQDDNILASSGYDDRIWIWNLEDEERNWSWDCGQKTVYALAFTPHNDLLLSAGQDGTFILWRPPEGKNTRLLKGHFSSVYCVSIASDAGVMASGGRDGKIKIWDIETWSPRQTLQNQPHAVLSIAWTNDASLLAAGSVDRRITIWDPVELSTHSLERRDLAPQALAFSPDNNLLVVGWADGAISVWSRVKKGYSPRFIK